MMRCLNLGHQAKRGQRLWTRLFVTVAVVAAVTDAMSNDTIQRYILSPFTRQRVLQEGQHMQFVEMPPQHRLLAARRSFFATCLIIKVCVNVNIIEFTYPPLGPA